MEVSKFTRVDLLVYSIKHSEENKKDYYKATVKAYYGAKKDFNTEEVELDDT
jgi:hypothetical protein